MNLFDRRTVRLLDVATVERAKAGKTYPQFCTIVQISASQGQTEILRTPSEVEAKYAVVRAIPGKIDPVYLFFLLEMGMPSFFHRYQTTINMQIDAFKHMHLDVHKDMETQREIGKAFYMLDERIADEQRAIDRLKDFKSWHLDTMFA